VIHTEGVRYVADTVGAYWLIEEIAFTQKHAPKLRNEDFQNWELVASAGGSAVLICYDGNGHRLYVKQIEWTDFLARASGSISATTPSCCPVSIEAATSGSHMS
jgi:hypothetical protein